MTRTRCRAEAALGVGLAAGAVVAYLRTVEPWLRRWGATDEEVHGPLVVDDLVERGAMAITRAITVNASIADVWAWLVQIGQDRAGFYSYSFLENLVGAGIHNAGTLAPEWQTRTQGDTVWLASERRWHERGRQIAAVVDPPRALVLVSPVDWARVQRGELASGAWAFVLEPRGESRTRLLVRSSGGAVGTHLFDGIHFLMEQKMMRGLRDRAEASTS